MAIQVKRSTEDIRKNSNVVLEEGQPLYTTDSNELFISDGITPVKDLKGTVIGLNLRNGATEGSVQSCEFSYIDDGSTKNVTSSASAEGTFAYGENCTASGLMSFAFGKNCTASGKRAWAGGNGVQSRGNTTIALGQTITGYAPGETYNGYTSKEGASACAIFGNGHYVLEPQCLVAGYNHKLYAKHSTTVGQGNTIQQSASGSFAGGCVASIYAPDSIAYGLHLTVPARSITKNIFVDGKATDITLSIPTATFGSYNAVDLDGEHKALLVVGNGVHDQNRSNAFEVLWDGRSKAYKKAEEEHDILTWENKQDITTEIDDKDATTLDSAKSYTDTKIADLNVSATTLTSLETISSISETDGKISVTKQPINTYSKSSIDSKDTTTLNSAKSYTDAEIAALDVSAITGSTTQTITSISEANGKISATYSGISFPVTSVDGMTGDVTIPKRDDARYNSTDCFTSGGAYLLKNSIQNTIDSRLSDIAQSDLKDRYLYSTVEGSGSSVYSTATFFVPTSGVFMLIAKNQEGFYSEVDTVKYQIYTKTDITDGGSTTFTIKNRNITLQRSNNMITVKGPSDSYQTTVDYRPKVTFLIVSI